MAKKPHNQAKKPRNPDERGNRKANGQFKKGNKIGLGNSNAANSKAQELKDVALAAVSVVDIKSIIKKLVSKARAGDIKAATVILDRCLGKPVETDDGRANIPTSPNRIPFEEVMQYVSTVQKLPPLGGIDMKSIEESSQVLKIG